ncbi:MAG TPA: 5-(carboxyamino)imidazole ribonucleotide synthase [Rhizomicrobium sp.]|jgi:5-(carboxyamino)imidazole ribonucleotide synthase
MSPDHRNATSVSPGGTIGILGGGQLGRMLAQAAAKLGLRTHIYCDEKDAPAFEVAAEHTHASYDDREMLADFARACDAITFEFENIPSASVAFLETKKPTHPGSRALATAQDRLAEKTLAHALGWQTAPFAELDTLEQGERALERIGTPAILKTRRQGYDGKGQARIERREDLAAAWQRLAGRSAILEGFVAFAFECSVIAARGRDGTFAAFDPPENSHGDHILRVSRVPAPLSRKAQDEAIVIARSIADALDYVGVFAVEFFVTKSGELLVNEIAPRVHNSGHWTIEACTVSQFEQHIRAVAGWPLGDPSRHSDAVMENLVGEDARDWAGLAASGGSLHLYGKTEIRSGRKMGHITRLSVRTHER